MKIISFFIIALLSPLVATANDGKAFFIENVGQISDQYHRQRADLNFSLQGNGVTAFIGVGKIEFVFARIVQSSATYEHDVLQSLQFHNVLAVPTIEFYRLEVELINANKNVKPIKKGRLEYHERYYYPQFGEDGAIANSYSKIIYPDIYPHIDWVIYLNDGKLEYEFVVNEEGNANDIKIVYNGATALNIDSMGNLVAMGPMGTVTEHAPISYQSDGKKVATSFQLVNNILSYKTAPYQGTLLIDPYIEWATYYGGIGEDNALSITEDATNNVYICGQTQSYSHIATTGAYDASYSDSGDAFIAKFDSDGGRLWGTYYGGVGSDYFTSISYDNHGCIFVQGSTTSMLGIATIGSDQPNSNGGGDVCLVKFDSTGNRLWGTYFGGNSGDISGQLGCDLAGNVYMVGLTSSSNSIATPGAHQTSLGGESDGFIAKYNTMGSRVWSTYYGGNSSESGFYVAVGTDGKVYMTGSTTSGNNISTQGTFQYISTAFNTGFITAFDENGVRLWGTYYGGATDLGYTRMGGVCTDNNGGIFVTGYTQDTAGFTTPGCHQAIYGGAGSLNLGDAIIAKFDNTGNRIWGTYFGGSKDDLIWNVVCNSWGEVYIVGITTSVDNIAVNAIQSSFHPGGAADFDGWIAKIAGEGSCIWSTYIGGTNDDRLQDVCVSGDDVVYAIGKAKSAPVTIGSHQQINSGGYDGYIVKFKDFPTYSTLNDKRKLHVELYPNPNNGTFILSANLLIADAQATIAICDISGKEVYKSVFENKGISISKQIELDNNLPSGLYIINFISQNQSIHEKFIKIDW